MDEWLSTTRDIQTNVYGKDPAELRGDEHRQFIWWNLLAAHAEITEALEETNWKPWANFNPDEPVVPNKAILCSEIVDAQMFLANVLVSAGVTDEEYQTIYAAKWEKNIGRQRKVGGYVSKRGVDKCTSCGRALDDVGESAETPGHCLICWPNEVKSGV